MTPEEQIANIKKGNAERSKKYYDKNIEIIKERRRLERVRVHELKQLANNPPVASTKRAKKTPENSGEYKLLGNRPFSLAATGRVPDTSKEAVVKAMDAGIILPHAKKTITADMNIKERMKAKAAYSNGINGVNLMFRAIGNDEELHTWLQKPDEFLEKLPTLKTKEGADYSKSQWQKTVGVLLIIIKYMRIPITEEQDIALNDAKNDFKMKYTIRKKTPATQTPAVKGYERVLTWAKKDKNPLTHLLAILYEYAPIRTDYENIKTAKKLKEINKTDNFIILPEKGNAKLLVQTHKTEKHFGKLTVEFPAEITY
jgi:hypothetical protein